jgi:S-(hydroxymethyl)glutathione dehydrogenase/alcohol dehydrogenase
VVQLRAAVLVDVGRVELRDLESRPLTQHQVLVDVICSGVCGSQVMEYRGRRGPDRWLPHLFGHEGVGIVRELGSGVGKVSRGDRVGLTWIRGSGNDSDSISYNSDWGPVNAGQVATLASAVVVAESRVYRLPDTVSDHVAVLLGCALPTGAGMALNALESETPRFVAVVGLGGVGMTALLATLSTRAEGVIAVDTNQERLEFARSLGVDSVVNPRRSSLVDRLRELTGDRLDLVLESSGSTESLESCFEALSRRGRLVFASHPPTGERMTLDPHQLLAGKRIAGSWGGDVSPEVDIDRLMSVVERMDPHFDSLLGSEFRLDDVQVALDAMERGEVLRPLIRM